MISKMEPNSGSSGTEVTIFGGNFTGGVSKTNYLAQTNGNEPVVIIGGIEVDPFPFNDREIQFVVPEGITLDASTLVTVRTATNEETNAPVDFVVTDTETVFSPGVTGVILRSDNRDSILGAGVTLEGQGRTFTATTVDFGEFDLTGEAVPIGVYRVTARKNGFAVRQSFAPISFDGPVDIVLELDPLLPVSQAGGEGEGEVDAMIITFADANLEAAVRNAIGKPTGDILLEDVAGLTVLDASFLDITDLAGIEFLTDLVDLNLFETSLTTITQLGNLSNLRTLDLGVNSISDITPLAELFQLESLGLIFNDVSNIGPLTSLTNLTSLDLSNNQITEITPLVNNLGIDSGDFVTLNGNPLSQNALCNDVPILVGRGVFVSTDVPCG